MQSFTPTTYLILICASAAFIPSTVICEKLVLSVFYESLCPDSVHFMKNQVYPVYKKLSSAIQLDLVPYGFAHSTIFPNGTVTFTCQHGPKECFNNKLHVCAVTHMTMEDAISFIHCTISQKSSAGSGPSCAKELNLTVSYNNVNECVQSEEGDLLLAAYGMRTKHANPSVDWVPWIIFNNIYNKEDMDASQKDLKPVVCKKLHYQHPECYKAYEVK